MNINKLRGKIIENGMTVNDVASYIGMDRSTFYRKLNNEGETFTIKEVNLIRDVLNLTVDEAVSIFFTNIVA